MADITTQGEQYRLRAGAPMSKGQQGAGDFVIHTFMAEKKEVINYLYTNTLPRSTEFRGQGGQFTEARFQRLNDSSGNAFSGNKIGNITYVEEDQIR